MCVLGARLRFHVAAREESITQSPQVTFLFSSLVRSRSSLFSASVHSNDNKVLVLTC